MAGLKEQPIFALVQMMQIGAGFGTNDKIERDQALLFWCCFKSSQSCENINPIVPYRNGDSSPNLGFLLLESRVKVGWAHPVLRVRPAFYNFTETETETQR